MSEEKKQKAQESKPEELKDEYKAGQNDEWAADSKNKGYSCATNAQLFRPSLSSVFLRCTRLNFL